MPKNSDLTTNELLEFVVRHSGRRVRAHYASVAGPTIRHELLWLGGRLYHTSLVDGITSRTSQKYFRSFYDNPRVFPIPLKWTAKVHKDSS